MRTQRLAVATAVALPFTLAAQTQGGAPSKELGVVTVTGGQPTSGRSMRADREANSSRNVCGFPA